MRFILLDLLSRSGPIPSADLRRALGVSASTLQRVLREHRTELLVVGRARAVRYAARRSIAGVSTPIPIFEFDEQGTRRHALTLHPVQPFGFYVEAHTDDVRSGFHETDPRDPGPDPASDLPWFLSDLKPAGFMGKAWARAHQTHGFASDPLRWSGDDVLRYATSYATDSIGAFVVGHAALDLVQAGAPSPAPITPNEEEQSLPLRARDALQSTPWNSSAGGEQPKFLARMTMDDHAEVPCIVKFSPPMSSRPGRRWADLLVAEHLAHQVLREIGFESATSRLVTAEGRRFLAIRRFDRHGPQGRSGLASLASLDRSGVAWELRRWSLATQLLVDDGLLDVADHERVHWLEAFGHLIANTDMHPGNLSFRLRGTRIEALSPVYDMLPMFHAPRASGEVFERVYDPFSERTSFPVTARNAALAFWKRVEARRDVSQAFRRLAGRQRERIPRPT